MSLGRSPSPRPSSGSSLVMDVSTNEASSSHRSSTVTVATMVTSLWLGGHSTVRFSSTVMMGGVVSSMVITTSSLSSSSPSETTRVTVVTPTGNAPVGVGDVGSSNTMPGADHRNVRSSPLMSPEPVPSRVTRVVGPVHSSVWSGPASASGGKLTSGTQSEKKSRSSRSVLLSAHTAHAMLLQLATPMYSRKLLDQAPPLLADWSDCPLATWTLTL